MGTAVTLLWILGLVQIGMGAVIGYPAIATDGDYSYLLLVCGLGILTIFSAIMLGQKSRAGSAMGLAVAIPGLLCPPMIGTICGFIIIGIILTDIAERSRR